jgi:hypothetical protein
LANIFDVLDGVRERPSMYYGHSLCLLEIYCHGYYTALSIHGLSEHDAPKVSTFHFGEWLYRRFGWYHSCGWAQAIRRNLDSDEDAFDRFFQLIDEYRILRPVSYAAISLGPAHKPTGASTLGSGAWPLPPAKLEMCRYEPEDFYFLLAYYPACVDDRSTFASLEAGFSHVQRLWQVKPAEWSRTHIRLSESSDNIFPSLER